MLERVHMRRPIAVPMLKIRLALRKPGRVTLPSRHVYLPILVVIVVVPTRRTPSRAICIRRWNSLRHNSVRHTQQQHTRQQRTRKPSVPSHRPSSRRSPLCMNVTPIPKAKLPSYTQSSIDHSRNGTRTPRHRTPSAIRSDRQPRSSDRCPSVPLPHLLLLSLSTAKTESSIG